MTGKIKNAVGIFAIIALSAFAYAVVSYSGSFSRQIDASSPRVVVSGEGKVVAIPNLATFNFGVITEGGEDVTSLQNENTKKMNVIIAFLKSEGVSTKDIKTTGYNIQPRNQRSDCSRTVSTGDTVLSVKQWLNSCPPNKIVGYTVKQNVTVKIRDFSKSGSILAGVGQKGANTISQLVFSVDNRTKFEDEARGKAIKQAKERAQAIAKSAGFSLGRLLSFNENKSFYYPRSLRFVETKDSVPSTSINLEPGSQEITSSVTLQYQIK